MAEGNTIGLNPENNGTSQGYMRGRGQFVGDIKPDYQRFQDLFAFATWKPAATGFHGQPHLSGHSQWYARVYIDFDCPPKLA